MFSTREQSHPTKNNHSTADIQPLFSPFNTISIKFFCKEINFIVNMKQKLELTKPKWLGLKGNNETLVFSQSGMKASGTDLDAGMMDFRFETLSTFFWRTIQTNIPAQIKCHHSKKIRVHNQHKPKKIWRNIPI